MNPKIKELNADKRRLQQLKRGLQKLKDQQAQREERLSQNIIQMTGRGDSITRNKTAEEVFAEEVAIKEVVARLRMQDRMHPNLPEWF